MRRLSSRDVALMAIGAVLTYLSTVAIQVYIPATKGYFNIGEVMVYTWALLFGPWIGAFSAGVGSMMADVLTGYEQYAPATLIIKGIEGFIVGKLHLLLKRMSISRAKVLSIVIATVASLALAVLGLLIYSGVAEVTFFALSGSISGAILSLYIPWLLWVLAAIIFIVITGVMVLKVDPMLGIRALIVVIGGLEMVLGYFIYESVLYGPGQAMVEVPYNIGQMLVGLAVSIPLSKSVERKVLVQSIH